MDLPSDVLRSIISICKISDIESLSLVNKLFLFLCCERNLWLVKFNDNNLEIIDDKINTVDQYVDEYKKISYATYTANCLVDMVRCDEYRIQNYNLRFSSYFSIDKLTKILNKDHTIFNFYKYDIEKNIEISIYIREKGTIHYKSHKIDEEDNIGTNIFTEDYDINFIISLIIKILYHYPLININDFNDLPLIISKNNIILYNQLFKVIPRRKKYWDGCYSKYEDLYF